MVPRVLAAVALIPALALAGGRGALPADALATLEGRRVPQPKAPVLVVAIWSSTCAACTAELKDVEALATAFANDREVAFLAVDVDAYLGTPRDVAEKAARALKTRLALALDGKATFARTLEVWANAGPSEKPELPDTVTMPAFYVVDAEGHTRAEQKFYRDTKPSEFVEKYRPLVETAKKGELESGSGSAAVSTTVEQDQRDVAVSRGKVRLKYAAMSDAQIQRTLPDVRAQLAKMFPKATPAKLDEMVARAATAMKKGEAVEFDSQ
jgi:hypothetical protein